MSERPFNLDGKSFCVTRNDGPGAAVTTETRFHFRQEGDVIVAEYAGGGVRLGRLVGLLDGATMRHRYVQVNSAGELQSGQSSDELRWLPDGRIQLIDSWQWESQAGRGFCIMEEEV